MKPIVRRCVEDTNRRGTRLMPNIRRAHLAKTRLLAEVVHSTVCTLRSPTWAQAIAMNKYKEKLNGCERKMATRVISAYRTVLSEAALVIAGMVPIDLMAEID
ncbi:hypothetical protein NQ315_014139 [Exocentrus adspersus]|uniref:Uncharacterized protein n=1 Tax=Exocentrus adspersus TaxID=1586481 RepID=A0AAV8VW67_9CUCU|nr:hypothetical protein NQ315_014139 [Exocentrus adspersus]